MTSELDYVPMDGVREYNGADDVELVTLTPEVQPELGEPRLAIRAFDEDGDHFTFVDLRDLIAWVHVHQPRLLHDGLPSTQSDIMEMLKNDTLLIIEAIVVAIFIRTPTTPENLTDRTNRFIKALDLVGCKASNGRVLLKERDHVVLHGWNFNWAQEP